MVEISERVLRLAAKGGWIGVDFDGTLAEYYEWVAWGQFGKPIPLMVERVRAWIAHGVDVRIVTARVGLPLTNRYNIGWSEINTVPVNVCRVTGEGFSDYQMVDRLQDWTELHVGKRLPIQCYKDVNMIEIWDDRAVQVIANTGRTLADEYAAELTAQRGKQFAGAGNDCRS
jgi:hypothetical protein